MDHKTTLNKLVCVCVLGLGEPRRTPNQMEWKQSVTQDRSSTRQKRDKQVSYSRVCSTLRYPMVLVVFCVAYFAGGEFSMSLKLFLK